MIVGEHERFVRLVTDMRYYQVQYFKHRTKDYLIKSKDYEKKVDNYLNGQTNLFQ